MPRHLIESGNQTISGSLTLASGYLVSGGIRTGFRSTAVDTIITLTDHTIHATDTCTVTLPTAVGIAGQIFEVKASNLCIVILEGDGSELIDGNLNITISGPDSVTVQSTGTGWIIK